MSSNFQIPGTKPPKAVTTLADLDAFFTTDEQADENDNTSSKPPVEEKNVATIDLSKAEWLL